MKIFLIAVLLVLVAAPVIAQDHAFVINHPESLIMAQFWVVLLVFFSFFLLMVEFLKR